MEATPHRSHFSLDDPDPPRCPNPNLDPLHCDRPLRRHLAYGQRQGAHGEIRDHMVEQLGARVRIGSQRRTIDTASEVQGNEVDDYRHTVSTVLR